MNPLDAFTLEELLDEIGRRVRGHARGQVPVRVSAPVSADRADMSNPDTERRERWRRSKAEYRARRRAAMSADTADMSAVVVVQDLQQQQTTVSADMSATRLSADRIPGLEHTGPAPAPAPAPAGPDDIGRRRLRTGVAEILARAELHRQRTAGRTIENEPGWLRTVAATIGTDRAEQINTAVETALTRWPNPTPAHVAELVLAATPATGRTARQHVPVNLPAPQPPEQSLAALAGARAALRRAAS